MSFGPFLNPNAVNCASGSAPSGPSTPDLLVSILNQRLQFVRISKSELPRLCFSVLKLFLDASDHASFFSFTETDDQDVSILVDEELLQNLQASIHSLTGLQIKSQIHSNHSHSHSHAHSGQQNQNQLIAANGEMHSLSVSPVEIIGYPLRAIQVIEGHGDAAARGTSIIAWVSGTLAEAGFSIFYVSTNAADYVLVQETQLQSVLACLKRKFTLIHEEDEEYAEAKEEEECANAIAGAGGHGLLRGDRPRSNSHSHISTNGNLHKASRGLAAFKSRRTAAASDSNWNSNGDETAAANTGTGSPTNNQSKLRQMLSSPDDETSAETEPTTAEKGMNDAEEEEREPQFPQGTNLSPPSRARAGSARIRNQTGPLALSLASPAKIKLGTSPSASSSWSPLRLKLLSASSSSGALPSSSSFSSNSSSSSSSSSASPHVRVSDGVPLELACLPYSLVIYSFPRSELARFTAPLFQLIFFPPAGLESARFFSYTIIEGELSLILPVDSYIELVSNVPSSLATPADQLKCWCVIEALGTFDVDDVGLVSAISTPLGNAGFYFFYFSSWRTGFVLVQKDDLEPAKQVLTNANFIVK